MLYLKYRKVKRRCFDIGNYAGMTLKQIHDTNPKNLVFLRNNSGSLAVVEAASLIIESDPELAERFGRAV